MVVWKAELRCLSVIRANCQIISALQLSQRGGVTSFAWKMHPTIEEKEELKGNYSALNAFKS